MRLSFAKLIVPESNETKEIDVAQTWEVRWHSVKVELRYSSCDKQPEMEVFTNEAEAQAFAQSLRNAMSLARLSGIGVEVEKRAAIR